MKNYALSLIVGFVVGSLYAMLRVRSPAPPLVALTGLLGMVGGEAAFPWLRDCILPFIARR